MITICKWFRFYSLFTFSKQLWLVFPNVLFSHRSSTIKFDDFSIFLFGFVPFIQNAINQQKPVTMKTINSCASDQFYPFSIDSICMDYASLDWVKNNSNDATGTATKTKKQKWIKSVYKKYCHDFQLRSIFNVCGK